MSWWIRCLRVVPRGARRRSGSSDRARGVPLVRQLGFVWLRSMDVDALLIAISLGQGRVLGGIESGDEPVDRFAGPLQLHELVGELEDARPEFCGALARDPGVPRSEE